MYTLKIPSEVAEKAHASLNFCFCCDGCDGWFRKSGGCLEHAAVAKREFVVFPLYFRKYICANVEGTHLDNISLYLDHYIDLYLLCTYKKHIYKYNNSTYIYIYIYSMHGATLMQKCRALIFFLQPVRPSERCKKAVVLDRSHRGRSRMRMQNDLPRHVHFYGCIYTHDTIYTKSIAPMSTEIYTIDASL